MPEEMHILKIQKQVTVKPNGKVADILQLIVNGCPKQVAMALLKHSRALKP